ncbi:MAG: RHS repeat-associated core domain-containing protein, partial [Candidatus Auribacter fodinae]
DAFGQVIGSGMPGRGFSSKEYNERTSLSYFGARYYDASIGRFISRDPLGFVDGPIEYIYCVNNPLIVSFRRENDICYHREHCQRNGRSGNHIDGNIRINKLIQIITDKEISEFPCA